MLELLPTPKFECDIIGCTSNMIARPIKRFEEEDKKQHYFLPDKWETYNKYNAKSELVAYHICSRHEIFKRR